MPAVVPIEDDGLLGPLDLPADGEDPSPQQWIRRLGKPLRRQRKHAKHYDAYYKGERELAIVRRDFAEVFGDASQEGERVLEMLLPQLPAPRANVSRVGVDAYVEKMRLDGFEVGDSDEQGARDAAEVLQRNDMDEGVPTAHRETFIKGASFIMVWPDADGRPVVTAEDATQVAVAREPVPPYDVRAAMKVYPDEWTGREVTALYLQGDGVRTFRRRKGRGLVEAEEEFDPLPAAFAGRVPIVELANRQRLLDPPTSELVDVAPLADNHAKLLADMVIAASFGAIPIRTATGIKLRFENGQVVSPFDIRADRILTSENPNARYGQLEGAQLGGYVAAIELLLTALRLVTRVPQHYYGVGASAGMSGETLRASEASLNAKVTGSLPMFGGGHRRWMRLALSLVDGRYAQMPIRPLWAPVETRIPSMEVDAFQKAVASKVPVHIAAREFLRWTPQVIAELVAAKQAEDAAAAALLFGAAGGAAA